MNEDQLMSEESQRAHIIAMFRLLFNRPDLPVAVDWDNVNETIFVNFGSLDVYFLMEIGSDDDRYRFELWLNARDTGVYVEFALPGEQL